MNPSRLQVPGDLAGDRLDQALVRLLPQHSRSRLQGWVRSGFITVNDSVVRRCNHRLSGGEKLEVTAAARQAIDESTQANSALAEDIPLSIIYADESIMVINKPAGLITHQGAGNWCGTLQNALLHHAPELSAVPRAGIVHRLDKDTSGLLVIARTPEAQTNLVRQLQARTVSRKYLAVACGSVRLDGKVEAPIARHPRQRTRMALRLGGKPALTHYRVVQRFANATLLECTLDTGRTHQIRVHLASIGHPLLGDRLYGGRLKLSTVSFNRQALHAWRLALAHPQSGESMCWQAAPPEDFASLLAKLGATATPAEAANLT